MSVCVGVCRPQARRCWVCLASCCPQRQQGAGRKRGREKAKEVRVSVASRDIFPRSTLHCAKLSCSSQKRVNFFVAISSLSLSVIYAVSVSVYDLLFSPSASSHTLFAVSSAVCCSLHPRCLPRVPLVQHYQAITRFRRSVAFAALSALHSCCCCCCCCSSALELIR